MTGNRRTGTARSASGVRGPGQVLFEFVRHWSRRSPDTGVPGTERGRLVLVTEAVHSLNRRGTAATVNAVADEIGIDQSGASRLVKSAAEAGYLELRASPEDGRRRHATITPSGRTMLDQAHDWQERVFERLTYGWSEQQRRDFQRAMVSLIERSHELDG
ncbi:DNA-binding MarR family transcriptional regulator [Prauserella shujinwangii]|uniref:DNA-binding MarR family transcriptional regulator n=1 Tax=Prauserella shujinwangii TaxID=1453103 RepID=A0A2T0LNU1_9PSEU|nr:MarR family winged helix-turn-helix transcriptional regulator [Prauserella shujinwangii]PRX44920.1 DNA-binding MarR family transcriptional regulator [Prauserella shujinwangii]